MNKITFARMGKSIFGITTGMIPIKIKLS